MHGLSVAAHSTNVRRILALDLGKFNSVLCIYDPATHAHRFISTATSPQAIHDLLVAHQTEDASATLLVIETCDVAGWCTTAGCWWIAARRSRTRSARSTASRG